MHYSWIIWQLKLIWVLTGNISIEPRGPEVDALAQLWPSVQARLSSCVMDVDDQPCSHSLSLQSSARSMWSQCWPWAHIHWDRWCSHGLITFLEQNSQIPSKSANLLPGHTLPRVADKSAFYCFMLSFHPCSPGFWLHVFTNLLTVH